MPTAVCDIAARRCRLMPVVMCVRGRACCNDGYMHLMTLGKPAMVHSSCNGAFPAPVRHKSWTHFRSCQ